MKYFRVKTGFEEGEIIRIDETELEKAIKAHGTGAVAVFKEGSISGNNIISILPDWQRIMGWNRGYKLNDEDWEYIGEKKQAEYHTLLEDIRLKVDRQLKGLPPLDKISDGNPVNEGIKTLSDKFRI